MEEFPEFQDVPLAAEDRDALIHEIFHHPELSPSIVNAVHEAFGDVRGGALDPGVKEHQVGGQLLHPLGADRDRCDRDLPVLMEADVVEAAVGCHHLVLRPNRLLQDSLLEVHALRS